MTVQRLAPTKAAVAARRLGLDPGVREHARSIAAAAPRQYGLEGKREDAIAAAAVYYTALLANDKRTQKEVADTLGVGEASLRASWREIREHEYPDDPVGERVELYQCTECGKIDSNLGWLHAHIDAKHRGWGPWNIIPSGIPGNGRALMEYTDVLEAEVVGAEPGGDGA